MIRELVDEVDYLHERVDDLEVETVGRSTPTTIRDTQHRWDRLGRLWCYNESGDVWLVREQPMPGSPVVTTSARSYQRLVAEFGPLRPWEDPTA
jgi:hypothetical protein